MASIRKKISMAFGLNSEGSPSTSKANSIGVNRGSIDSGYHSMIAKPKLGSQGGFSQVTTFVNSDMESSPERSPKKLHKAISTTFSGAMQAFSDTVRSTTLFIYPTAGEPELPSSEWAECETPKKESRRSSIMSSVRRRKQHVTPRASDAKRESPERPQSPVPATEQKAPALDVEIPNPCFSYESLGKASISAGSQLLAGVKLPAGPKNLWPRPTRLTVDPASRNDRQGTLNPVSSKTDDPYVDKGSGLQHGLSFMTSASEFALESSSPETNNCHLSDDKGYFSEVESNADVSESDGLGSPCRHKSPAESHIRVASVASPYERSIPTRASSSVPSESKPSKRDALDGTNERAVSLHPPSRASTYHCASLEEGLNDSLPSYEDAMTSKSGLLSHRLPSDVCDADDECLESSMGSRAAWERHRADRERRYLEIIDMAPNTESDEEVGPELELKRSPSKKPVHNVEELGQSEVNVGVAESAPKYSTGDLRYAVEAIERPAFPVGDLAYAVEAIERPAFPVGDLSYAVEAIERPSVTTFDPLETVYQQRPMLCLSNTTDEQETSQVSDLQKISPSRIKIPSSPPADLSPSRMELPSSPESFSVDIPAAPKYTMMSMTCTDEELMRFGAGNLDGQSIRRSSFESTDISANSSPKKQSRTSPEHSFEAGPKAGGLHLPTYLPQSSESGLVGEDAYEAGQQAADTLVSIYASDVVQPKPAMDNTDVGDLKATSFDTPVLKETSHGTYREQLEASSILPKPRSRNGTPFEHSRTVSALSDDTDDSCTVTTHSPSCNAPPPSPDLHVRSEPARRISSAIDALVTHGDEQTTVAEPANSGINPSLPSPLDGPGDQTGKLGSKLVSPRILEGSNSLDKYAQGTRLEQHDLQSLSPGFNGSIQSRSNSNTPQKTLNAANMPSFFSPPVVASRKARRKLKKSSSGMGTVPLADPTMNPRNVILEPDDSPSKRELDQNIALEKTQTSLGESARIAGGSIQKPSPKRHFGRKNRYVRDQTSLEEFTETVGSSVRWLDPSSKSKSSKRSPNGRGKAAATLPVTSSPPELKIRRARGKASTGSIRENAGSVVKDSVSRFRPEFSIQHFNSMSDVSRSYANQRSGSTSYAGYELDSVFHANPSVHSYYELDEDLQQDSDKKAVRFASDSEIIGEDSESDKDAPCDPGHETSGKPPPEVEKKVAVQRELERKSDRARCQLVGKLNSGALKDDHVREDEVAQKDGRPPWRP